MLSDSNDDFRTPPSSPTSSSPANPSTSTNLCPLQRPSTSTALSSLQPSTELIDLDMNDSDKDDVDQLAERLQTLEKMKIEMDEIYYKLQDQLFDAIGKCEAMVGNKLQNQLLDALNKWKEVTTKTDAMERKPRIGEKLERLQRLIDDSRQNRKRMRICGPEPPKYLDHVDNSCQQLGTSSNCNKDTDIVIHGLDSERLAELIRQKLCQQHISVKDQRYIDKLRRQLASQRKGDLENALKTTTDENDQQRISALLRQGELYQELQKAVASEEENELRFNISKLPYHTQQANDSKLSSSQEGSGITSTNIPKKVKVMDGDLRLLIEQLRTKQHSTSSSHGISSSALKTSSTALETSSPAQDTLSSALETSSPAQDTLSSTVETSSPVQNRSLPTPLPLPSAVGTLPSVLGTSPAQYIPSLHYTPSVQHIPSVPYALPVQYTPSTRYTSSPQHTGATHSTSSPEYSSVSTSGALSSTQATTFLKKPICAVELEGGICQDVGCHSAHLGDYRAKQL